MRAGGPWPRSFREPGRGHFPDESATRSADPRRLAGGGDAGRWADGPCRVSPFPGTTLPCPAPSNLGSSTPPKATTFLWHRCQHGAVSPTGLQAAGPHQVALPGSLKSLPCHNLVPLGLTLWQRSARVSLYLKLRTHWALLSRSFNGHPPGITTVPSTGGTRGVGTVWSLGPLGGR